MNIRVAQEADRNILIRDYLQHVEPDLAEAEWFAARNLLQDQALFLEEDGKLIGTLSYGIRDRVKAGLAEITSLRIIPSRRGQGLGHKLLQEGLAMMDERYRALGATFRRAYCFVPEGEEACAHVLETAGFACMAGVPGLSKSSAGRQEKAVERSGGRLYFLFRNL